MYDDVVRGDSVAIARRVAATEPRVLRRCAHFLENHDERRIASLLAFPKHSVAALLLLSLPGMRLIHEGQLNGARLRVPIQVGCRPEEQRNEEIACMYEALLGAVRQIRAGEGEFEVLFPRSDAECERGVLALLWRRGGFGTLTLVNFSAGAAEIEIMLPLGESNLKPVFECGSALKITNSASHVRVFIPPVSGALLAW